MRWLLILPLTFACAGTESGDSSTSRLRASAALPESTALAIARERATANTAVPRSVEIDSANAAAGAQSEPTSYTGPKGFPALPAPDSEPMRFDVKGRPILPIVLPDYCQGESCESSYYAVACLPTGLRATPTDSARIVTPVVQGDTLRVRRDLYVRAPGIVVVKKDFVLDRDEDEGTEGQMTIPRQDTVRFVRGDTVLLLAYVELGKWVWAYHGELYTSAEFWADAPGRRFGGVRRDSTHAVTRSRPKAEDWWLAQPRKGAAAWWRGDGHLELQSISGMQRESDDCAQVRERAREERDTPR
jgi:hypothetical protein